MGLLAQCEAHQVREAEYNNRRGARIRAHQHLSGPDRSLTNYHRIALTPDLDGLRLITLLTTACPRTNCAHRPRPDPAAGLPLRGVMANISPIAHADLLQQYKRRYVARMHTQTSSVLAGFSRMHTRRRPLRQALTSLRIATLFINRLFINRLFDHLFDRLRDRRNTRLTGMGHPTESAAQPGPRTLLASALLFAFVVVGPGTAFAAGHLAGEHYTPPRAPGTTHPDFNGVWQAMNEANYDLEAHVGRPAMSLREGPHGPLPSAAVIALGAVGAVPPSLGVVKGDGTIPYKPQALAKRDANHADWLNRDPEVKCYLPGIPRANYIDHPFQILQGERSLFFAYQYAGAVRDVYLKDPGLAPVDSWMGQSVATWDGDTLVIDVTAQNGETWFDRAGNHHSGQLHVRERYTLTGPDHIRYQVTITDPETFTRPWDIEMILYRRVEANAQIMQFKCVEYVEELLYGKWRRHPLED